jgi:31-O-methyltransferase
LAEGHSTAPRVEELGRLLHHDDPSQLLFQLAEIVGERIYVRHGVEVGAGDVVLDVGANVGVAAAFFASECGAGVVHSFEPVEPIFRLLSRNLRHFQACVGHNYGLASSCRRSPITYYPKADAMSGLYADADESARDVLTYMRNIGISGQDAERQLGGRYDAITLECELRTLSSVLREESLGHVDLLKVDFEKAELDVLRGVGGADWPRIRQVVAEVHDQHGRAAAMARMLTAEGFSVHVEQEPEWAGTPMRMLYAIRR